MMSLSVFIKKSRRFARMGLSDQWFFLQAFMLCGMVRLAIIYVPFKKLKQYLGVSNSESTYELDQEAYPIVRIIAKAVHQASRYTPWESKCLVQAITAQRLLKKAGIGSTLYLGVNKDAFNRLHAHAWLRCGRIYITGGREQADFTEVAKWMKSAS